MLSSLNTNFFPVQLHSTFLLDPASLFSVPDTATHYHYQPCLRKTRVSQTVRRSPLLLLAFSQRALSLFAAGTSIQSFHLYAVGMKTLVFQEDLEAIAGALDAVRLYLR